MYDTIVHYENDKIVEIHHGYIFWLNTYTGDFWFETRVSGQNRRWWGRTDYWSVCDCTKITGKIIVL